MLNTETFTEWVSSTFTLFHVPMPHDSQCCISEIKVEVVDGCVYGQTVRRNDSIDTLQEDERECRSAVISEEEKITVSSSLNIL